MLNEKEWAEVEDLVNTEYMSQVDDAGFEAVLAGVKLATAVLEAAQGGVNEPVSAALEYLGIFGNWRDIPLRESYFRHLMVRNYGVEEANALIEKGWKPKE